MSIRPRSVLRRTLAVVVCSFVVAACSQDLTDPVLSVPSSVAVPTTGLVRVADGVLLEYRDWGGDGPPIVLLTGLGNTAAVFDDLAPRIAAGGHRVIGLTRRGFPPSTVTAVGYDVATRVADDVAALAALGIARAVLVGHSIAGDELTGIARARPDVVAGLVYLDAALDRSDPSSLALDECFSRVPSIEQVVDLSADVVEVDGELGLVDLDAAARLQRNQLGGPLPTSELRRQFAVAVGGALVPLDPGDALVALKAGTEGYSPEYRGISVPLMALYGDDSDPAVAFPVAALATPEVLASLTECAEQLASAKRTAGADRVRDQVPGAVVEIVPGGPHYFFLQQPDLIVEKILEMAGRADW